MLKPQDFFALNDSAFKDIFDDVEYVWDALKNIKEYAKNKISSNVGGILEGEVILFKTVVLYKGRVISDGFSVGGGDASKGELEVAVDGEVLQGASVIYAGAVIMGEDIYIGEGSVVEPGALIKGATYIGNNTEVRQGAYLRGNVLIGDRCVVGHTTEMKSSIMLGDSKAGHFAYIGDSILGKVNLGAGTKLANLKVVDSQIVLKVDDRKYETGLTKFGAILGDGVETGCNTVTSPGTFLAPESITYPNTTVRGYHSEGSIIKVRQNQEIQRKRT